MNKKQQIDNFTDFWDFYISEHSNLYNRLLHFIGTSLAIILLIWFLIEGMWLYLPLCLVCGYGFAWVGHFFVEKNKPASFQYPIWSFISDYVMLFYMISGKMNSEIQRVAKN